MFAFRSGREELRTDRGWRESSSSLPGTAGVRELFEERDCVV